MGEHSRIGRRIGRYELLDELGRGSMGVVYRARDPVIGRVVALKTLSSAADDPEMEGFRRRLYREAAAAGSLTHPNIVAVYDVLDSGPVTAVAMEYVDGQTLAAVLERGRLALPDALAVMAHLAAGLDYAGARGIVHRDIKPANILIGSDGCPKIADFGIARLPESVLTRTGAVLGSPAYMSPEQVRGQPLDPRSDLFSAATVFYEMLTGFTPFCGGTIPQIMDRIVRGTYVPAGRVDPAVNPAIDAVLARALSKEPAHRYATGLELTSALRDAAGASAPVTSTWVSTPSNDATGGPPPVRRAAEGPRPSAHQVGFIIGAVGLAASCTLAVLLFRGGGPHDSGTSAGTTSVAPATPEMPDVAAPVEAPSPAVERAPTAPSRPAAPRTAGPTVEDRLPAVPPNWPPAPAAVVAPGPPRLRLDVQYAGQPFPVDVLDGDRQIGRVEGAGAVDIEAGTAAVTLSAPSVFFRRTLDLSGGPSGMGHAVFLPGLGSAVVGIRDEIYAGVRILVDDRLVSGPYPAQLSRLAAGPHVVRIVWTTGQWAGTELTQPIEVAVAGHLLIRAIPEEARIAVQRIR